MPKVSDIAPPKRPRPVNTPSREVVPVTPKRQTKEILWHAPEVEDGSKGCVTIAIVYVAFYLAGVLLFWMLGGIAHRSTLSYPTLDQANSLTEVRDELVKTFGPVAITPPNVSLPGANLLDSLNQNIQNASTTLNAVANTAQTVQSAANTINQASNSLNQAGVLPK